MMVSLIIPTYNEAANIGHVIEQAKKVLADCPYEIIVVDDDSPDQTWSIVSDFSKTDAAIQIIRRTHQRGLSSAVVAGFEHANGDILAVMDADLSHDIRLLPEMICVIQKEPYDFVIGSRRVTGGSEADWSWYRQAGSYAATQLARFLTGVQIADPMSGFFCIKKDTFIHVRSLLRPKGYKILLELLVKSKSKQLKELPYQFINRRQGESKVSMRVIVAFLFQLIELTIFKLKS
ncbi:MAG: hypothetical protein COV74_09570 [Candidatus Omnitrophica bacterium CG11_big_fil_rev_8_21_14_0_20_45_26]|uniref:Glycosyltransferase 2-like domain-containing protein n=1 Tax=Candidatus Abzuiibacterium crystallinum TaxID=1974748 RepID=A0A2H0LLD6_9BACT|nr:MAG: hypothetical protein COV74_09570 [Candidatus Omnitrophica bacterium CG11_big_fil_rev_8_21_14_0_20_45_26]PIW65393.1 MAG: hypothetical protein COW12_02140 [Candidatus Omnitrophica bacterium CG12_big_fil_rev_8_21_14_0_65_45_16]